jgi:hypothetical protein
MSLPGAIRLSVTRNAINAVWQVTNIGGLMQPDVEPAECRLNCVGIPYTYGLSVDFTTKQKTTFRSLRMYWETSGGTMEKSLDTTDAPGRVDFELVEDGLPPRNQSQTPY